MVGNIFRVGDRVELVEDYGYRKKGEQGTIQRVHGHGRDLYDITDVRMDTVGTTGGRDISCYNKRLKAEQKVFDQSVFAPQPASKPDAIYMVAQSVDRIFPRRSYDTILKSLMEEMGELSTEIAIVQGTKKRAPSPDGVKGEAVDVFVVAVDMLRAAWGDELFTTAFTDKVASKLAKWEGK
jgi:NTP pyrophosphatase (non-canonical NTP hydrolase)